VWINVVERAGKGAFVYLHVSEKERKAIKRNNIGCLLIFLSKLEK